ncbi:SDR family oxidoreductase [Streptomyces parvulus]|uniref:SDR family oxidoreductase n=1 Tax=Streptomyces parvulus TaxID=146923 RepID=UPI00382B7713
MTDNLHILVLGGTGKTGSRVATALRKRGHTPSVASRHGPVLFDWSDSNTWKDAVAGVQAVYVVDSSGDQAPAEVKAFCQVAARAGVRRLVLLSARVFGELGKGWLDIEEAVKSAAAEWTILRPTWFAQNFTEEPTYFGSLWDGSGELRLPTGNGHEAFIDLEDLADCAASALSESDHEGKIYVLSGAQSLTMEEAVGQIAAKTGLSLRFQPVTEPSFRAELAAVGKQDEGIIAMCRNIREERGAEPVDGVRDMLGRPPKSFTDYVNRTDFNRSVA